MKDDLLEKALKYAKHDDYHVTRRIITDLCNEIERLRELNKDVFSRIQDNKEIFNHAAISIRIICEVPYTLPELKALLSLFELLIIRLFSQLAALKE